MFITYLTYQGTSGALHYEKVFTIKKKLGWTSGFHARDDLPRAH